MPKKCCRNNFAAARSRTLALARVSAVFGAVLVCCLMTILLDALASTLEKSLSRTKAERPTSSTSLVVRFFSFSAKLPPLVVSVDRHTQQTPVCAPTVSLCWLPRKLCVRAPLSSSPHSSSCLLECFACVGKPLRCSCVGECVVAECFLLLLPLLLLLLLRPMLLRSSGTASPCIRAIPNHPAIPLYPLGIGPSRSPAPKMSSRSRSIAE